MTELEHSGTPAFRHGNLELQVGARGKNEFLIWGLQSLLDMYIFSCLLLFLSFCHRLS